MFKTSLDNSLTRGNQQEITAWGIPDYSAAVQVNAVIAGYWNPAEAPADGVFMTNFTNSGMTLSTSSSQSDSYIGFGTCFLLVKKGTWANISVASGYNAYFIPFKGV